MSDLDPLFDGATLFAEPTVIADQAAIAHSVDDGGELRCREVVDPSELLRGHAHVEGEQDVSLEAADTLNHQGGDVSVATVLAQQGGGMEEAGHHVVGDRDGARSAAYIGRPSNGALVAALVNSSAARAKPGEST